MNPASVESRRFPKHLLVENVCVETIRHDDRKMRVRFTAFTDNGDRMIDIDFDDTDIENFQAGIRQHADAIANNAARRVKRLRGER